MILLIPQNCFMEKPATLSREYEASLDQMACQQMRESGWSEKEIEEFMDQHGGEYFTKTG